MASADFVAKRGDKGRYVDVALEEYNHGTGTWGPVDLTAATSVRFVMQGTAGAVVASTCAVQGTPTAGVVRATFGATDLTLVGEFQAEVEVTWSPTSVETYPNGATDQEYLKVIVLEDKG